MTPGTSQQDAPSAGDAERAADLLRRLLDHGPADALPPLGKLIASRFARATELTSDGNNVVSLQLVRKAASVAGALLEYEQRSYGLHGDFFPDNILLSDRDGWLAIDPQPVQGARVSTPEPGVTRTGAGKT